MVASGFATPRPARSGAGKLDVRRFRCLLDDDLAPELRRFEHVRLVDRTDSLAPFARGFERHARDAPNLAFSVAHGVEAFALAVDFADALGLAEVDVAGQLAHDQDVEAGDHLGL